MPEALACPKCGGSLPLDAARNAVSCPFCNETVVPAPRVIERVVERIVVKTAEGAAPSSGPACPRCAGAMRDATVGKATLRGCTACGGIWLRRAEVDRLTRERDDELAKESWKAFGVVALLSPRGNNRALISCPECGAATKRAEIPNTVYEIDVCPAHGTWFDRGELTAFIDEWSKTRAGELSDEDLQAAGLPGSGGSDEDVGAVRGFFRNVARLFGGG
jgi:Zn-finger nucleic acid-binding protein